nr:hypothetical protein [Tanacetum cinerariifolium]
TIMSDSEDSTVTYTTVFSPCEGRSGDISPGVDGPPVMPKDPYAFVVAAFQALPPPDYLMYPEYIPPEDDVFPAEEQPLPAAASPNADSPGYIPESDPDEDPEDNDEDPADYPADHDDDDEEEEEPSRDYANKENEEQDEDDDDEEEEHPASADSIPPPPRVTARITFRPQPPTQRRRAEDIGYGIRDTWIDPRDVAEEEALTTLEGVNTRVTELAEVQEQDTQDIYEVMEDTQGLSSAVYFELQGYMTHTWVQNQRIDTHDTLIATLTTQLSSLQGHLATALGEIRALQAREQACAGAPKGAGSST